VRSDSALGAKPGGVDPGRDELIPEILLGRAALLLQGVNAAGLDLGGLLSQGACLVIAFTIGQALLLEGLQMGVLLVTAGGLQSLPEVDLCLGLPQGLEVLFPIPLQRLSFGDAERSCGGVALCGVLLGVEFCF
jgi:hypothetical protein